MAPTHPHESRCRPDRSGVRVAAVNVLLLTVAGLLVTPSLSTSQETEGGWEVQVVLDGSRKLSRRVRPLFLQKSGSQLQAPILGSLALSKLMDWGVVGNWPGLAPTWVRNGPQPIPDLPENPNPSWTTALEESGPRVMTFKRPLPLPLVPEEKELPIQETIWAITSNAGGPIWGLGIGSVGGAGMLTWQGFWTSGDPEAPANFQEAFHRMPHRVFRHARAHYRPFRVWRPSQSLSESLGSLRYNRVEGGSLELPVRVNLSPTFQLQGSTRLTTSSYPFGWAGGFTWDYWPSTFGFEVYRKLEDANRWEPAERKRGNSLMTFLVGQDDGHYYTGKGASFWFERGHGLSTWRLSAFAESDRTAPPMVDYSLFPKDSLPVGPDLVAEDGDFYGLRMAVEHQRGLLMEEGILISSFWIEATDGDRNYLKTGGIVDGLISGGWWGLGVRAGGGWVSGDAPLQREYFLGGATSIRGFPSAILQGPRMALGRLEAGIGPALARVVGFGDVGWAGDSERMPRRASVGVGLSIMEGWLRLDFAKPLQEGYGMKFYLSGSGLI